ncbi:hypothetical protein BC332_21546 [Capsicum chinense]|nr:hypothetical protein BC332_21546 [Capsicum chinense]
MMRCGASSSRSLRPLSSMNHSYALSPTDTLSLFVLPCGQGVPLKEFNDYFNALKERCSSTVAYLKHDVGFEKWSRAHFPGNRFNVMTTNIVESLNSMLLDEREYPVANIFNSIAHRFGQIFRKRYAEMNNSKTLFVPVAKKILRKFDLVKLSCVHTMAALRLNTSRVGVECGAECLEMQVLPPNFDPKEGMRRVRCVKVVLVYSRPKKRNKCSKCKSHPMVLKTSRTDKNSGRKFYICAVGKDNGGCSYFKWIPSNFEESKFQGIAKFEISERLRDSKENKDLLMTLFRELEHKIDHLKRLLEDVKTKRDQLKHRLAMAEEKTKGMKIIVYSLLLVLDF